ncbi:hypothetical protein BD779DRAFT_1668545 [Infundibulicybe gibba]|nr:hypothetical protein BD779DRAFT_1668545 [Infundibulicybe gibba]
MANFDYTALIYLFPLMMASVGAPVTPPPIESHDVDPNGPLELSTKRNIAIGICLAFAIGLALSAFICYGRRCRQPMASSQPPIEPPHIPIVLQERSIPP